MHTAECALQNEYVYLLSWDVYNLDVTSCQFAV